MVEVSRFVAKCCFLVKLRSYSSDVEREENEERQGDSAGARGTDKR